MATTFILPADTTQTNYEFEAELDGISFRFRLKFNSRDETWVMSLHDAADAPLRSGVRVVSDWPLLKTLQNEGRPEGQVITVDLSGLDFPGIDQLGDEVLLTYLGEA